MRSIYAKAMWDQRRSLSAWGSAVAGLILLEASLWPSIGSMPSFDEYLQEFPEALRELFAVDQMATGTGFLNAELFTLMLPMLFIVYGISRGSRMIAGEEEAGTLDLLLVTPLSSARLLLEEALALLSGVSILGGVAFVSTTIGSAVFGLDVSVSAAAVGSSSIALLGLEFGAVALVAGALTGRRGFAMGTAAAVALGAYVLFVAGIFVAELGWWQQVSPFHQALRTGPLTAHPPASLVWVAVVPVALVTAALPLWSRRDVGVS